MSNAMILFSGMGVVEKQSINESGTLEFTTIDFNRDWCFEANQRLHDWRQACKFN